jgi:transposase
MLDGYEDRVEEMLERQYIGTRIHEELTEMGFEGSLSTVHRHIREIKKEAVIREKVTTRFETPPGRQMQYDWKEWQLPVAGRAVKIYLHEVVLGYSRKKHYSWSLGITASDVIRAIEAAILFFEGVASELVIDNPKQMVLVHDRNGVVRYTDEFLTFCGLYGIDPSPCQNYRARIKGYASYYTSFTLSDTNSSSGYLFVSFRPCHLKGLSAPGVSKRHSCLSL